MKSKEAKYRAALYMRLSKDDDGISESSSITTQRKMLMTYAKENAFFVYGEYIDDGWSGTNFDRPDFKRMIRDIEDKKINLVITKDLSRLGRDYITTGQYTEIYFPTKGVRYIAINDGYDSDNPYNDIAPFKNMINEMYARDTSKKIRSAFVAKMEDGCFIGNFAPYGYRKDPGNKNHLLIDDATAPIVRNIFDLAAEGKKPIEIARCLNSKQISTPAMYRCEIYPYLDINQYTKRREWTSATISKMLANVVYLGHMAQGKTTKVSFKSDVTIQNDKSDWKVVENTHESIISGEIFDIVSRRSNSRTCMKTGSFCNIFSGIVKCKDCGHNMSTVGTRKKGSDANLACGSYKLYRRKECSNHFIDYNILYDIVLKSMREELKLSDEEKQELIAECSKKEKESVSDFREKKEIDQLKKRVYEIDRIIEKLYEDHFLGVITEERYGKLLAKYEGENKIIEDQMGILLKKLEEKESISLQAKDKKKEYTAVMEELMSIKTLTPEILYKVIDHIEIGQGYFERADHVKIKCQRIEIYYRFQGKDGEKKYFY